MRRAFQTFDAMPTTMGALSHTSACTQGCVATQGKQLVGKHVRKPIAAGLGRDDEEEHEELAVDARAAQDAADPAIEAEVDKRRERPDFFGLNECSRGARPENPRRH